MFSSFTYTFSWCFNVVIEPLSYASNAANSHLIQSKLSNANVNKNYYIQRYKHYIQRAHSNPISQALSIAQSNIPKVICDNIVAMKVGNVMNHYQGLCDNYSLNVIYCIPNILGYIQMILNVLYFAITIFSFKRMRMLPYCYVYPSHLNDYITVRSVIFVLWEIICCIHFIGVCITYYRCKKYANVIHKFQMELYEKYNSSLFIDPKNTLFAWIAFQKWLNVPMIELDNYQFLNNQPLLVLILSKYWAPSYIMLTAITSNMMVTLYEMSDETRTFMVSFGIMHTALILFYCHLRVTFSKSANESIWYLCSLLSAVFVFLFLEILLVSVLERGLIHFEFDNTALSGNNANNQFMHSQQSYYENETNDMDYDMMGGKGGPNGNNMFSAQQTRIYESYLYHLRSFDCITNNEYYMEYYDYFYHYFIGDFMDILDFQEFFQSLKRGAGGAGLYYFLNDVSLSYLPNLRRFLVCLFIPISSGVILVVWFFMIEYGVFMAGMSSILANVTLGDLSNINIINVSWQIKGGLFDLYYFMPFYRIMFVNFVMIYAVYIGCIMDVWMHEFDGFLECTLTLCVIAFISVVYVYIQQQLHCLMSGFNEYQYALKYIAPNSCYYLWRQWSSLLVFR